IAMEDKKLAWPSTVKGTKQITGYDPIRDNANSKLPQDVVSCFAMAAFGIRRYWSGRSADDDEDLQKNLGLELDESGVIRRERDATPVSRWNSRARTSR
ncbi:MAG: hypothetical protein NT121_03055, partial [Chloroflexi bacterium]|nr:hypothetical protein [Chloroflexota bacterium]